MCSCLTVLPAVSDVRKVESNPRKHESCPIRVIFREDARVAIRQGHAALTRVVRVRDCDVWSRSGYADGTVREIFHDRTDGIALCSSDVIPVRYVTVTKMRGYRCTAEVPVVSVSAVV